MKIITLLRFEKCLAKYDIEYDSNWSDEELLNHIVELYCVDNNLESLPNLPNCLILHIIN